MKTKKSLSLVGSFKEILFSIEFFSRQWPKILFYFLHTVLALKKRRLRLRRFSVSAFAGLTLTYITDSFLNPIYYIPNV